MSLSTSERGPRALTPHPAPLILSECGKRDTIGLTFALSQWVGVRELAQARLGIVGLQASPLLEPLQPCRADDDGTGRGSPEMFESLQIGLDDVGRRVE